ncbi:MAG: hypothetical protein MUF72_13595 [Elainella sp. Prado103]|jgi:hypothetical protein|nr:hypothetical protein [Elainella sp. Prado103]
MKEYIIRGFIGETEGELTKDADGNPVCPFSNSSYQPTKEDLRIDVWDRDVRFNDRLASTTTAFGVGIFELRFTDQDFRQEPGESELEPDVFFEVFRQRQLLFTTEAELIPENSLFTEVEEIPSLGQNNFATWTLPIDVNEDKQGYPAIDRCYRLVIQGFVREIPDAEEERPPVNEAPTNDVVVDVLPTSDQIMGIGRSTVITGSSGSSGSGGSLQQIVENAFGQVLGHSGKPSGANAFRNALSQAFTLETSNGRETYKWNPRSYATTQNELGGAITGAQASLYNRAKAALKEILPLLDGLYELDPSADRQNREAVRSIVRTELIELVNEFGLPRGPRSQRVDSLFRVLMGSEDPTQLPEQVGGQLRDLANVFGLQRSRINTVEEERNFGNFLTIQDYVISLRQSWNQFISIQASGAGAFIGTQLVLLSQALSVMAESVRETYRIMDLVFLGAEERQSVLIDFSLAKATDLPIGTPANIAFPLPDGTGYSIDDTRQLKPPMDLERLMSWVMSFATEEGPTLARSGGKLGIANVLADTAERLMILLQAASYVPVKNSAFRREGVLRALRDLAFQTYQVQQLAKALIPPSLTGQADDVSDRTLVPFLGGSSDRNFSRIS